MAMERALGDCVLTFLILAPVFGYAISRPDGGSYRTIVVDKFGRGGFETIQNAVNSVPSNNVRWVRIVVKAGIYREKVVIPSSKPYIYLQGEGMMKTQIVWNGHSNVNDATFTSSAHNFMGVDIGFVNSYNYPSRGNNNPMDQAVAAKIDGDESAFYECGFFGLQDTLYVFQGRQYYFGCNVVGAIDFIFGPGLALFENCEVNVAELPRGVVGYITAQKKEKHGERSGFVFKSCRVTGGPAHLGRAWGAYATVIFYRAAFSNIILPPAWSAWHFSGHEGQMTFVTAGSNAKGVDQVARWSVMSADQAASYAKLDFIDANTWLFYQPKPNRASSLY